MSGNKKPLPRKAKSKFKITKPALGPKQRPNVFKQGDKKKSKILKRKIHKIPSSKCLILLSQAPVANTQPCYIITNAPSNNTLAANTRNTTGKGLLIVSSIY